MKKLIIGTFKTENELQEYQLIKHLESINASISIIPFNEHFKNNKTYKALKKSKKVADDNYYNFLNDNR